MQQTSPMVSAPGRGPRETMLTLKGADEIILWKTQPQQQARAHATEKTLCDGRRRHLAAVHKKNVPLEGFERRFEDGRRKGPQGGPEEKTAVGKRGGAATLKQGALQRSIAMRAASLTEVARA